MPEYEFKCSDPECACKFLVYYGWKSGDGINYLDDPNMQECVECGAKADQLWSLTTMRPDDEWAGYYFQNLDYHSTSKSRREKWMKEKGYVDIGDRTDREGMAKWARDAGKYDDEKKERQLEKFLIDQLKDVDIGPQNSHIITRESRRKEQKRLEMESAHPEDVAIDPAFL
jgi:nitrogen fixation-related uncharacterized protein